MISHTKRNVPDVDQQFGSQRVAALRNRPDINTSGQRVKKKKAQKRTHTGFQGTHTNAGASRVGDWERRWDQRQIAERQLLLPTGGGLGE